MIKERIIQVIEYKGIAKEDFYKKIGMTSANFRGDAKKRPLNSNAIENILSEIPDLNPEWLLTGKGEMLRGSEQKQEEKNVFKEKFIELLEEKAKKLEIENKDLKDELQEIKSNKIQTCKTD